MFKRYPIRSIKSDEVYSIRKICFLFRDYKLHDKTIRGWLKSGQLKSAGTCKKEILIHGSVLKAFFRSRNNQSQSLEFNELKCRKCRSRGVPKDRVIHNTKPQGQTIIIYGKCNSCDCEITRCYAAKDIDKLKTAFIFSCGTSSIIDSVSPQVETHPGNDQKALQSECKESDTQDIKSTVKHEPYKHNDSNEVIKYSFCKHLIKRKLDEKSIEKYRSAVREFEISTGFKHFKTFNESQAEGFKDYLSTKLNAVTDNPVSKQFILRSITGARIFFQWLSNEKGYSRYIKKNEIEYLTLSKNEAKRARMSDFQERYTVAELLSTIRNIPIETETQRRAKAIISLCLLTTPRVSALKDARITDIRYIREHDIYCFTQRQSTKYAKEINAFFIGQSKDIIDNVINWKNELEQKGFTKNDPLFPQINSVFDTEGNSICTLSKAYIKKTGTIRTIFEKAFKLNNMQYINPHSFRHTMVRFIMNTKDTIALSALSDNVGHTMNSGTLLSSYGRGSEQENIIALKNVNLEPTEVNKN